MVSSAITFFQLLLKQNVFHVFGYLFIDDSSCLNHFRAGENVLLVRNARFQTTRPAFKPLACISSGSLQVRYNLGGLKEPFAIDVDQRNLANGQPHSINMSRVDRSITIQVQTTHTHKYIQAFTIPFFRLLDDAQKLKDLRLNFKILLTSNQGVRGLPSSFMHTQKHSHAHTQSQVHNHTSPASVSSMVCNKSEGRAVSCSVFCCDETTCPLPLLIHFQ